MGKIRLEIMLSGVSVPVPLGSRPYNIPFGMMFLITCGIDHLLTL